jgi:hypothetical protein
VSAARVESARLPGGLVPRILVVDDEPDIRKLFDVDAVLSVVPGQLDR